jgi:RNA polymerase sigma factor (sigma-70 family)
MNESGPQCGLDNHGYSRWGRIVDRKSFRQNDPTYMWHRNQAMLTLNQNIPCAPPPIFYVHRRERNQLSPEKTEISQQTVWMLAVRDDRDRAAFDALFDYFAPRLKGFIMRSGTSAHQAEEIVQDVMLTIWRKAGLFDPHRAQVSAWIYQIARNRQIDIRRKENRPVPEELAEDPGAEPDAGQILAIEQEAGKLRQALARLKGDQQDMIKKAYMGEMTHQEISKQTGLPLGTIKSRIRLGLERLRHELKGMR